MILGRCEPFMDFKVRFMRGGAQPMEAEKYIQVKRKHEVKLRFTAKVGFLHTRQMFAGVKQVTC